MGKPLRKATDTERQTSTKKEEAQRAYDDIDQEYNESLAQLKISSKSGF